MTLTLFGVRNIYDFFTKVEELFLDNVRSTKLSGLTDSYTTLMKLSIVNCGLVSLEGLPRLPSLEQVTPVLTHTLLALDTDPPGSQF